MNFNQLDGSLIINRKGELFKCEVNKNFRPITSNLSYEEWVNKIISVGEEVIEESEVREIVK